MGRERAQHVALSHWEEGPTPPTPLLYEGRGRSRMAPRAGTGVGLPRADGKVF